MSPERPIVRRGQLRQAPNGSLMIVVRLEWDDHDRWEAADVLVEGKVRRVKSSRIRAHTTLLLEGVDV